MSRKLFIKKTVSSLQKDASKKTHTFQRSLGALNLTTIGLGAIIGAGLFVLTGTAAAEYAGPGIVFSFIIGGIIAALAAFCYAEFASSIPVSGSAYTYSYVALGELTAWIIGWGLTLQYLLMACTVAVGWSGYLHSLFQDFGITLPKMIAEAPLAYDNLEGWSASGSFLNLPAMCIVAVMGCLIAIGTKTAASFNNVLVAIKLIVVVLFIGCGIGFVNWSNFSPMIPENLGSFGQFGWSGVLRGAGVVFFAFIGFDALSTLTQESKYPQKDMPRGMIGSLGISTICYVLMSIVLVGIVNYKDLNVADPIAVAVNVLGPKFLWFRLFSKIAILAGLTSVIMVTLLAQTRIFYTMAHDGLLPKFLGKINDKHHNPLITTMVVTLMGMVVAGILPVLVIGQVVAMATLMAFAVVCFGVLVLRVKQPFLHRPFKTPLFPWIPLAGMVLCISLMFAFPFSTWMQLIVWTGIGLVIYFKYGIKHSVARLGKKR